MNQQLRINYDPDTTINTIDDLTLELQVENGAPYVISTAKLYVYDGEDLVASGVLGDSSLTTNDVDESSLKYTWSSAENLTLSDSPKANYRALWILNSGDRRLDRFFDVVYWKLLNPITTVDVLMEKPELSSHSRPERSLVATANGTTTTLICNRVTEPSDFFNGSEIIFNSGSNDDSVSIVTDWNRDSSEFTLEKALDYATSKNDKFLLRRSFEQEINAAWSELFHTIQAWRPMVMDNFGLNKLIDSLDLRLPHLYKSIINIYENRRERKGDTFDLASKDYSEKFSKAISELKLKIDENNDGIFDEENDLIRTGQLWFQH
jgi:hypothetical protein